MSDRTMPEDSDISGSKRDDSGADTPSAGGSPAPESPPVFRHPQWMVGVVVILGIAAIFAGLNDPVWFVIGFPCILVLIVWVWVRLAGARHESSSNPDRGQR